MDGLGTLETLSVLMNPFVKDVFSFILRSRGASRYELVIKENMPRDKVQSAIDDLARVGLVGTVSAPMSDFDKFFPTGRGLTVEKMIA